MNRDRDALQRIADMTPNEMNAMTCARVAVREAKQALALPPAGGVEDGMVLVPREPTQAMIDALWDGLPKGFVFSNCTPRGVVASIIEAALSPTTLGGRSGSAQDGLPPARSLPSEPQAPSGDAWRPIESLVAELAPLGDRWADPMLVRLADGTVTVARLSADEFLIPQGSATFADTCSAPTHWMPLPAPPSPTDTASKTGASRAEGEQASKNTTPQGEES